MPLQGGKKNTIYQLALAKQFLKNFLLYVGNIPLPL